jgi:hypothetical protein
MEKNKLPDVVNPFAEHAAAGAAAEALRKLAWQEDLKQRAAYLDACEAIVRHGILPRLKLAADAVKEWGYDVEVEGVLRTETFSGTIHLRSKITISSSEKGKKQLEFIASPKSSIIAAEAYFGCEKRRWQKIAITADGISGHCDIIIRDFLAWGWNEG